MPTPFTSKEIHFISFAAFFVTFTLVVMRALYFFNAPDSQLITIIPDDAFYYLQMAQHRAADGVWSFDGVAPSTGFHLLYGYILVMMKFISHSLSWRELFLIISLCSGLLLASAAYFSAKTANTLFGPGCALFALVPYFTTACLIQSTAMMESWLVIFFSSFTLYLVVQCEKLALLQKFGLVLLGILGTLSRADFGLLSGMLFITFLCAYRQTRLTKLQSSAYILLGSCIGILLLFAHNFYVAGHLFQASAQIKLHWSSLLGHSTSGAFNMALFAALPSYFYFPPLWKIIGAVVFLLLLWRSQGWFFNRQNEASQIHFQTYLPMIAGGLTIVGYIVFYRFNSQSLQYWYVANFIAPIAIVYAGLARLLFRQKAMLAGIIFLAIYLISSIPNIRLMQSPNQTALLAAGEYIERSLSPNATIAAWNAGILSYFSKMGLINLDGLANDEVYPYILDNHLERYLKARQIQYVIDFEDMITNPDLKSRGGYAGGELEKCLKPVKKFDDRTATWQGSVIVLYAVRPECL